MRKIETLSSIEGRRTLHAIYYELRYTRQKSGIAVLYTLLKICLFERNLTKYLGEDISVTYPLGFINGMALWMEEVVNRFYFPVVNSLVYFGAAILLVLIGVRRFSEVVPESLVIAGLLFEAFLLLFMFVVMLFTPSDDITVFDEVEPDSNEELLTEVGEIARDFADAVDKLETLTLTMSEVLENQNKLMSYVADIAKNTSDAVSPNPELIHKMNSTNSALEQFTATIQTLNSSVEKIQMEQVRVTVINEIERLLSNKITDEKSQTK